MPNAIVNLTHQPHAVKNGAVRIDRRTRFGNPYRIGKHGSREQVIALYRAELWRRIRAGEVSLEELAALHGKTLACHGEVLARAAAWAASVLTAHRAA